jgi:hypothetical protein
MVVLADWLVALTELTSNEYVVPVSTPDLVKELLDTSCEFCPFCVIL